LRTSGSGRRGDAAGAGRGRMFRNVPILAIAMTAGLAALVLSGRRPVENVEQPRVAQVETEAWFV